MERREAERLYAPLAIQPASVSQQHLEASFQSTGFTVSRREELGSELIEFYEERDRRASRELMRIARMRPLGCISSPWKTEFGILFAGESCSIAGIFILE